MSRGDWQNRSRRALGPQWTLKRAEGYAALHGRRVDGAELTDEDRARLEATTPRARPVYSEKGEQATLADYIAGRWYAPGFVRWRIEGGWLRDGQQAQREGYTPGWPDCGLFLPGVVAVCELKARDLRPVTARGGIDQRGALSAAQFERLRYLRGCGLHTCVAYGWEMALAWFDKVAAGASRSAVEALSAESAPDAWGTNTNPLARF